jgi:hypothetical protein
MLMENFLRSKEYKSWVKDGLCVYFPPPATNADQLKKGGEKVIEVFQGE